MNNINVLKGHITTCRTTNNKTGKTTYYIVNEQGKKERTSKETHQWITMYRCQRLECIHGKTKGGMSYHYSTAVVL